MSSKLYGVDIALEYNDYWADLKGNSADIPLIDGVQNLAQAIRNNIMTPIGSNPRHPTYGSKVHYLIGKGSNTILDTIVRMMIMESLQNEGRIQLVSDIVVSTINDTINISISVISIYSHSLPVLTTIGGTLVCHMTYLICQHLLKLMLKFSKK